MEKHTFLVTIEGGEYEDPETLQVRLNDIQRRTLEKFFVLLNLFTSDKVPMFTLEYISSDEIHDLDETH